MNTPLRFSLVAIIALPLSACGAEILEPDLGPTTETLTDPGTRRGPGGNITTQKLPPMGTLDPDAHEQIDPDPPGGGGNPGEPTVPPRHSHGPVTMVASKIGGYASVTLPNGTVIDKDNWGNPLKNAVALAIRLAQPGEVIGVRGVHGGVEIGKFNPSKAYAAWWDDDDDGKPETIRDVTIVSADPNEPAVINGVGILGNSTLPEDGGIDGLYFENIILRANGSSASPVLVFMGTCQGTLGLYDVKLACGNGPAAYGGYCLKWGVRGHGRASYHFDNVTMGSAQEHMVYIDSPNATGAEGSYFVGLEQTAPSGRTSVQIVNRKNGAPEACSASGQGDIVIKDLDAWTEGGGGGSAVTIAGHLGTVLLDNVDYGGDLGTVVAWSDAGKGLYKTEAGFTCPRLIIRGLSSYAPSADRSHVMISGVGLVEIHDFSIEGNRPAIDLNTSWGGPVKNGQVLFYGTHVAAYPGFKTPVKVKNNGAVLTNAQINAMAAP